MLVLGLASISKGSLAWLEVDSGSTIGAGNTVTINMKADGLTSGYAIGAIVESSSLSSGQGTQADWDGSLSNYTNNLGTAMANDGAYIDNYNGALASNPLGGSDQGGIAAGSVIMSFDYTIDASWTGTTFYVAPLVGGGTYDYGVGSFTVAASTCNVAAADIPIQGVAIPEPATIALLGLGGLLLRKRK